MLQRRDLTILFDKNVPNVTSNLVLRRAKMTLGNSKQSCSWQYRTMPNFEVLKTFMRKKGFITKSNEFRSALLSGPASRPYNKIGTHLEYIILRITSSDAGAGGNVRSQRQSGEVGHKCSNRLPGPRLRSSDVKASRPEWEWPRLQKYGLGLELLASALRHSGLG